MDENNINIKEKKLEIVSLLIIDFLEKNNNSRDMAIFFQIDNEYYTSLLFSDKGDNFGVIPFYTHLLFKTKLNFNTYESSTKNDIFYKDKIILESFENENFKITKNASFDINEKNIGKTFFEVNNKDYIFINENLYEESIIEKATIFNQVNFLIDEEILEEEATKPEYFLDIEKKMDNLKDESFDKFQKVSQLLTFINIDYIYKTLEVNNLLDNIKETNLNDIISPLITKQKEENEESFNTFTIKYFNNHIELLPF